MNTNILKTAMRVFINAVKENTILVTGQLPFQRVFMNSFILIAGD